MPPEGARGEGPEPEPEPGLLLGAESERLAAVGDGALQLALLVVLLGLLPVHARGRLPGLARLAALGEGDEAGELVRSHLRPGLPELRLEVRKRAVEAGDGLDHEGNVRAELGVAGRIGLPVDLAFADG